MDCIVHGVTKSRTQLSDFHLLAAAAKSLQSCPTLCDPINGSPPGSTIPGTLQARTLELRGRFIAIQAYLKKEEKSQINNLTLHLKQLEKEEMENPS